MTGEDLSPADRELAQAVLMKLYLSRRGLDARAEWAKLFVRRDPGGEVRPRQYRTHTGSSPGSPQYIQRGGGRRPGPAERD